MNLSDNDIPVGMKPVTPSDSTVVDFYGLYVGTGGNFTVVDGKGNTTPFVNFPSGGFLPGRITKVLATGLTASNIVGFEAS